MSCTIAKRPAKRMRVYVAATLQVELDCTEVRVRDISSAGALIEMDQPPQAGTAAHLIYRGRSLPARVAWVDRNWVGLAFTGKSLPTRAGRIRMDGLRLSAPRSYRRHSAAPDPQQGD